MQKTKQILKLGGCVLLGAVLWAAITFNYGAAAGDHERDHIELEAAYNAAKAEMRLHFVRHGLQCRLCPKPNLRQSPKPKVKGSDL